MNPRTSPSGPYQALARFSISAPQAFADGVDEDIVFNRTDFVQVEGIGIGPAGNISVGPGLYFAQAQVSTSVGVAARLNIEIADGTADVDGINDSPAASEISTTCNGLLLATDAPFSPTIFGEVRLIFNGAGAAGNVETAELLVYKLSDLFE